MFLFSFSIAYAAYERYATGETAVIGEFVYDDNFVATTTAGCTLTIYDSTGSLIINAGSMTADANGWTHYSYSIPNAGPEGVWPTTMSCGSVPNGDLVKMDKSFVVGATVVSTTTLANSIWTSTSRTLTSFGTLVADVWNNSTRTLTGASLTSGSLAVQSDITTASSSLASVINANTTSAILTASSSLASTIPTAVWSSTSRSLTTFGTLVADIWAYGTRTLTSGAGITASDVWTYATRNLTSATLDAGSLAVQTDVTTASSSLGSAITNAQTAINANTTSTVGTASTSIGSLITGTNSLVTSASSSLGSAITAGTTAVNSNTNASILTASSSLASTISGIPALVWSYSVRTLSSFGALASDVWNATTRTLTSLTLSSQTPWTVSVSDFGTITADDIYRATVTTVYNGTLTDSANIPTVTIYDPNRNVVVNGASMTRTATGTYEYSYDTNAGATAGVWESVFSATVESGKTLPGNDYWNVVTNPAQVIINSMADTVAPEVAANITITNEGLTGYEYQYEWCVVTSANNTCGGGDDVFHGLAAKYINPGEDFNTTLTADVPGAGNYFFKVIVYFGTESSGASRSFTATAGSSSGGGGSGGGGGGGGGGGSPTPSPSPTGTCTRRADFNCDTKVNSIDFSILLYYWKTRPPFRNQYVDINKDDKIDSVDFSIMLYEWDKR